MNNPVPLNGFLQVSIVVEDIEAALDAWCELFDVPRPEVKVTEAGPNPDVRYRGATATGGGKLAVVDAADRGFVIEISEPDHSPSTGREFLESHGPGVHHLGFAVGDEAHDAIVAGLSGKGFAIRNDGVYPGGSWTIFDTESALGVNLNIKPHA